MRFLKTVMLAVATAGVMATQASAQTPVSVTFNQGTAVYTNNTGGAWYAGITDGGSLDLAKAIVYCIDQSRTFNPAQAAAYSYTMYTFDQFLASVATTATPWAPDKLTEDNLNAMAYWTTQYTPALSDNGTKAANGAIQLDIWSISTNGNNNPAPGGDYSNFRVLYNGQNQTFLVQIPGGSVVTPEPSTYALMAAGLAGLLVASRRRRQTNV